MIASNMGYFSVMAIGASRSIAHSDGSAGASKGKTSSAA